MMIVFKIYKWALIVFLVMFSSYIFFYFIPANILVAMLVLAVLVDVLIFVSYKKDVTIPYLAPVLKNNYFKAKAAVFDDQNKSSNGIKKFFSRIKFKFLYYSVILFKSSKDGFEVVREDFSEEHKDFISVEDQERKEVINMEKVKKSLEIGGHVDMKVLEKLYKKLFDLYREKQTRLKHVWSLAMLLIISSTTVSTLILNLLSPNVGKIKAASFGWAQNSWISGATANTANHTNNQTGWSEYASKDDGILASSTLELVPTASSTTQTTDVDFNAGTFNSTEVVGSGSDASVALTGYQDIIASTSGLVSYWKMNGDWTDSYGVNNGTAQGNMSFGDAKFGSNSGSFDGSSYIDAGSDASLDISDNLTIEAWFNPYGNGLGGIVDMASGGGENYGIFVSNGELGFQGNVGGIQYVIPNFYSLNTWYHVVITFSGGTITIYKDGAQAGQQSGFPASLTTNAMNLLTIGRYNCGSTGNFYGLIDEVAIYNRVLSPEEISSHYAGGPASGTFESATIDLGQSKTLSTLDFTASTTASSTVKFQIAVNNDNSTWNYVGPDGTASSYYETTGQAIASSTSGRYVRYKAYLTAGNSNVSPVVEDVTVNDYGYTDLAQALISSPYDTEKDNNVVNKISWTGTGSYIPYEDKIASSLDIVSYWKMNGDWNDSVGTYNGTRSGSGSAFGAAKHGTSSGQFNGIDDQVGFGQLSNLNFGSNNFTIEAWAYPTANANDSAVLSDVYWVFGYQAGGNWHAYMASSWQWDMTPGGVSMGSVDLNSWQLLTLVRDGNNFSTYKNGVLQSSFSYSGPVHDNQSIRMGPWGQNYQGNIDDVAIYHRALSVDEINSHYNDNGATVSAKFQIRTSPDGATWTDWLGPTSNSDYYTTAAGNENINPLHSDGVDDRYVQYKTILQSIDGASSPTISGVTILYGNYRPEVTNVTASQATDGTGQVTVNYDVQDKNTNTGVTPNALNVSLQYYNGSTWIDASSVTGDAGAGVHVEESTTTTHSLLWNAKADLPDYYSSSSQIRIKADDSESVANVGYGGSPAFTIDTKAPAFGSPAMWIDASGATTTIYCSATDDSDFQIKVSLNPDLSGSDWQPYSSATPISMATDPDTAYLQLKDVYGNVTAIISAATPETPTSMIIRDLSNPPTGVYQEFVAWKAVADPVPGFLNYKVYYSTDGINYSFLADIPSRSSNYYFHTDISSSTTYYYKVATEDANGDISSLSAPVSDLPDGQGGTDTTPPTITNVQVVSTTTQSAIIEWDTDELSDSTVGYSTSTGQFSTEVGVATMADKPSGIGRHQVALTGLIPGLNYYFQVKSKDPSGNSTTNNNGGSGFTFSTVAGAEITGVNVPDVSNTGATIAWNTDIPANSYVTYSQNANMSGSAEAGVDDSSQLHSVGINNLVPGKKYYFYVRSGVAVDNNGGSYYSFTTSIDTGAPVISGLTVSPITDAGAVIQWDTNEKSTSKVEYGLSSGNYTLSSPFNSSLNMNHMVALSGLTPKTTYYYRAISSDSSSNMSQSSESTFTTLETLSTETQVKQREEAAKQSVTGGGILFVDKKFSVKTDNRPPIISDIELSDAKPMSMTINWKTDENSDSMVDFGQTDVYDMMSGKREKVLNHSVTLNYLTPGTKYHYRVTSADEAGNLGASSDAVFSTPVMTAEQEKALSDLLKVKEGEAPETAIGNIAQKAMQIISDMASNVPANILESTLMSQVETIGKIAGILPSPALTEGPQAVTTATGATINWRTDREGNSLVAIAQDGAYQVKNEYSEVVGDPDSNTTEHVVSLSDLEPDTTYHYQIRSKPLVGGMYKSADFTFRTKNKEIEITNYSVDNVSNEKAVFKWATNKEGNSVVSYTPYRNNTLIVDETREVSDPNVTTIHEVAVDNFEAGTIYEVTLESQDQKGNTTSKIIQTFSTSKDDLPPLITNVRSESALASGKDTKVQTIISWDTNELATSRVYYQKGFGSQTDELSEKSSFDGNYTKNHVAVLTKFEPGAIYRFRVESMDYNGNVSLSKVFTLLVPRQKETVFQIIMKNFESIFGWINNVK